MTRYHLYLLEQRSDDAPRGADERARIRALLSAVLGQVEGAVALGLYRYSGVAEAEDLEDLRGRSNAAGRAWPASRQIGAGDIAVEPGTGEAAVCASFGWEALAWDRAERFLHEAVNRDSGWPGEELVA
ncbi:hypothetical protein LAZ40_11875 [Cereibacter sphaeroides]|uniref:hypothetical protein n=1 Tax=Cereibacter sphaeroides TaxID=1063 RepID=UPI001F25A1AB|nr:hypothetical protein [Cereibacter sphaeroides]MCE6959718.1 hypothetical protein [Cereibacter sphaeroides]MCE6974421.1 hypothetical protein [Cereibacter sphaeroides]